MSGTITISEKYVRKYDQQSAGRANLVQQTTTTDLTSEQVTKLNTAYDERHQWDGGATNLVAATGRASLNVLEAGTAGGQIRTNTQLDGRYVEVAGDTMTGDLSLSYTLPILYLNNTSVQDYTGIMRFRQTGTTKSAIYGLSDGGVGLALGGGAAGDIQSKWHSDGGLSIAKTTLTTGYKLDVGGKGIFQDDVTVKANLGTDNWLSETTGWRATYAGHLDMRSIFTDRLIAKAFIADLDLALLSGHMVTKSVTQVSQDFTVPATASTGTLYVEALPGFPTSQVFEDNDWIRLQVVDRSGGGLIWAPVWATVNTGTFNDEGGGEQSYTITIEDDGGASGSKVNAGAAAQDFGQSGDGYIQQEAGYAGTSDRPWLQIATWATDPSVGGNITVRARLGRLTGITDAAFGGALSGHGLYSNNVYLKGKLIVEGGDAMKMPWVDRTGRVGYWRMDTGSGTTLYDEHGNDGTLVGGTWYLGVSGQSVLFDGTDSDYAYVPHHADYNVSDLTIAFNALHWDKTRANDGGVAKGLINAGAAYYEYTLYFTNGNAVFRISDGTSHYTVTAPIPEGRVWLRWVGSYYKVGEIMRLYCNGQLMASTSANVTIQSTTDDIQIAGRQTTPRYTFHGAISHLEIYNRPFTTTEVMNDYSRFSQCDSTRTTIQGGVVTSGRIVLKDGDDNERAGICGAGTGTDIAIWAGGTYANRGESTTDFRVDYNGKLFATGADIDGKLTSVEGSIAGLTINSDALYTGDKHITDGYSTSGISIVNDGAIHTPNLYINSDGKMGFRSEEMIYAYIGQSSNILITCNAEVGVLADYYVETMSITLADTVKEGGRLLAIRWEMRSSDGQTVRSRIYKNGVYIGIERSTTSTSWQYHVDTATFESGDSIELWAKNDELGIGHYVYVRDLRITGDCSKPVNEISGTTATEG